MKKIMALAAASLMTIGMSSGFGQPNPGEAPAATPERPASISTEILVPGVGVGVGGGGRMTPGNNGMMYSKGAKPASATSKAVGSEGHFDRLKAYPIGTKITKVVTVQMPGNDKAIIMVKQDTKLGQNTYSHIETTDISDETGQKVTDILNKAVNEASGVKPPHQKFQSYGNKQRPSKHGDNRLADD